ncbi:hypothetical protein TALK_18810 [Thalassospira alkalitolerans]|uniref:Uncharacterized protein n=1 Tax=Thalassospira alkalitolerans TaxID=1293890 RepID=A0A1Y2LA03_9PROT|nr:hypothetical protein TALK_18810 [Thalassospira alkalitolerans]
MIGLGWGLGVVADQEKCPRDEAVLAFRKRRWSQGIPPKEPSQIQPHLVINPESHFPFTVRTAVAWLADQIEDGIELQKVILRFPPGQVAWELVCDLPPNLKPLYAKFVVKGGTVILRSFHPSER